MKKSVIKITPNDGGVCYLAGALRWPSSEQLYIDVTMHPEEALPLDAISNPDEQSLLLRDINNMVGVDGVGIDVVEVNDDV